MRVCFSWVCCLPRESFRWLELGAGRCWGRRFLGRPLGLHLRYQRDVCILWHDGRLSSNSNSLRPAGLVRTQADSRPQSRSTDPVPRLHHGVCISYGDGRLGRCS